MASLLLYLPYWPNIFWLKNYLTAGEVFIEKHESFLKGSNRNRCEIAGPNSRQLLSIPLQGGRDHHQLYTEVQLYGTEWQKKHWQSIRSAYGSAPFFEHYTHKIEALYSQSETSLFLFNEKLLATTLTLLKVPAKHAYTETYKKQPEQSADYRNAKGAEAAYTYNRYYQVFEDRNGFMSNLCVLDVIFNLGPQAKDYLLS